MFFLKQVRSIHPSQLTVSSGPCIRGHRSSKCDHRDRVLVEVRKPGRPLSSCPHPSGSCSCERVVINYTIPKSSECACPSERAQPTATVAGNSRIQKNRRRSTAINASSLEKAIRAEQDAETDTSSVTRAPTDRSGSNETSPLSSASSTPRLLPERKESISSCCKPKPVQAPVQPASCCSSKVKPVPEPMPVKSCCSGSNTQPSSIPNGQPSAYQPYGQHFQFQVQPQVQIPRYDNFQSHSTPAVPGPFSLGAPIYNHAAAAYHQQNAVPMSPMINGPIPQVVPHHVDQQAPAHNCRCGDSCSCFGCAAHPNNATMMEYVRFMAEFQYNGGYGMMSPPLYDMPTYPHHPGYGAEAGQTLPFSPILQGISTATPTQMSFQAGMGMPNMSHTPMAASGPWQPPSNSMPAAPEPHFLEPSSYASSTPTVGHLTLKTEEAAATPVADSPSDGKEEETPTLSPSSYFWNQMVLPSCSDATGTCQCGDGCECVGCLTHGGHNGVPLETPAIAEHETFPDFHANATMNLNDNNHFVSYNTAPT